MAKFWFCGITDGEAITYAVAYGKVGGSGGIPRRKIWTFRVSVILSGAICEAKMHCPEVVALLYIHLLISSSIERQCMLQKTYFITFLQKGAVV